MTTLETSRTEENGRPKILEAPLPWDDIVARALQRAAQLHPGKIGALRHAESLLHKDMKDARKRAPDSDRVVHACSSELQDPLVDFFVAKMTVWVHIFEVRVAQARRETTAAQLKEQLTATDSFVFEPDEDDLQFVPEVGLVFRRDAAAQVRELRSVVVAAEAAARGEETPFPQVGAVDVSAFEKDLRSFLAEHDESGRDFVLRLCADPELAKKVRTDQEMPGPIRYLAGLVLKTRPAAIDEKAGSMGFART